MTIRTFSVILALSFAWTACNNDTPQQPAAPTEAAPAASPEATTDFGAMQQQDAAPDPSATPGTLTATPQPATAPAPGGSGKVNPPHGQPGHVCGTPVGAPLDGAAAAKPAQNTMPAVKTTVAPPPAGGTTTTVAPGTNPPHGQPGHVCGTPVGAPLPKQ